MRFGVVQSRTAAWRTRWGGLLQGLLWLVAGLAALPVAADPGPVPHEYIPNPDGDEALRTLLQLRGEDQAFAYRGVVIQPPDSSSREAAPSRTTVRGILNARQVLQPLEQRGFGFLPDRETGLIGDLSYQASFDPMVAPFKRMVSLDQVALGADGRTPVLELSSSDRLPVALTSPHTVPSAGSADGASTRDLFWGEVTLDFSRQRTLPLPSVAPDLQILRLRPTPEVKLAVERDAADNYYITLRGPRPSVPVHLAFLSAAPRTYFGMDIPEGLSAATLAASVPELPPGVTKRARRFLDTLGLGPESDLRQALHTLVGYFRGFTEGSEPVADTGDIFWDLVRGRQGICRHRAYGFVVAAQALGVPARFVQNEAHSFVEVQVPDRGYLRIDLGGAATALTARGAATRTPYQPREPDRFPRPHSYQESMAAAARLASQVTAGEAATGLGAGRWLPPEEAPSLEEQRAQGSLPLRLHLSHTRYRVVRGERLRVEGHLLAGGKGVADLKVELSLAEQGRRERLLLGVTTSDAHGDFAASLAIPEDLAPGDYRLIAYTPGGGPYGPATAH